MRNRPAFTLLVLATLSFAFACIGCPLVRSSVNANESMRWWLFSNFGASKMCPEMLKRGVPLKSPSGGPQSIGRFFPQRCQVQVNDAAHAIAMHAEGNGYASLPMVRRIGFSATIDVEFRPDFRMESDALYLWGRFSRMLSTPDVRLIGAENSLVNAAGQTSVVQTIGQAVITSEIARGFTVVHEDAGDLFTLGVINPPHKPTRHFVPGEDHVQLETDVTAIGGSSREYLGPFAVESKGAALFLKIRADGAAVDTYFVNKATGDIWLQGYEAGQPLAPPPYPPLFSGNSPPNLQQTRVVAVPPGSYFIVVQNSAPPPATFGISFGQDYVATVSYAVEVGDKP